MALSANPIADATSLADLKGARLGAPVGTTSYQYIVDNIQPDRQPSVYNTLNDAIAAVKAQQIDGVVVDLPTAFYITAAELRAAEGTGAARAMAAALKDARLDPAAVLRYE